MTESVNSVEEFGVPVAIIVCSIVFVLLAIILLIASHVLKGAAISKMSKARGLDNGWLGFIPYANNYQLGQVAGEIEFGSRKIKNTGVWLLLMPILYSVVAGIGYAIMLVASFIIIVPLGADPTPEEILPKLPLLLIAACVFVLIILVALTFVYLFKYLALHKIFSQYHTGQRPVFYLIIAMFVPFAEPILLLRCSRKPLLITNALNIDEH